MTISQNVGILVQRLENSIGDIVLIHNTYGSDGRPSLFRIVSAKEECNGAFLSVRANKLGVPADKGAPLYQLTAEPLYMPRGDSKPDRWERNNLHSWGKNFYPGEDACIAIGREEIMSALQEWGYKGVLPLG